LARKTPILDEEKHSREFALVMAQSLVGDKKSTKMKMLRNKTKLLEVKLQVREHSTRG
jgi:hypothetical protein